jgi:hypothetical protein
MLNSARNDERKSDRSLPTSSSQQQFFTLSDFPTRQAFDRGLSQVEPYMSFAHNCWRIGLGMFLTGAIVTGTQAGDPPIEPGRLPKSENQKSETPGDITPVVAKVVSAAPAVNGADALPKALAEAKTTYEKMRDYSGYMVRQERIGGKLMPEQTAELRVRVSPHAVYMKTLAPKALMGQELSFMAGQKNDKVRVRAAGVAGVAGFVSLSMDDAKANVESRHTLTNTGIGALLKRMETALEAEKKAKTNLQILVAEYKFNDRPCTRYEVFCERPHQGRYAYRVVMFIDDEMKVPVRFEAYDAPKVGDAAGEMIECISFVSLKLNGGLGDAVFDK